MVHMVHIGVFSIRIKALSVCHFAFVLGTHRLLVVHIGKFGCEAETPSISFGRFVSTFPRGTLVAYGKHIPRGAPTPPVPL